MDKDPGRPITKFGFQRGFRDPGMTLKECTTDEWTVTEVDIYVESMEQISPFVKLHPCH